MKVIKKDMDYPCIKGPKYLIYAELLSVFGLEQKGSNMIALEELIFNILCLPQTQTAHPP